MAEVAQLSNQWKKALQGLSGILFALGLAETIASIIIINTSGGTYAGGIYAGILCMVTGIRGFVMSQGFRLLVLVIFSVLSGIISIVAASLLASNYNFLSSLYACESSSGTCSYISDYSSYCLAAYYCEISTTTVYDCSCAGSTDTCYGINHISCSAILTSLPAQIHASYIISILCIVASCLLAVMSSAAQFRAFGSMNAPLIGSDSSNAPVMTTATVINTSAVITPPTPHIPVVATATVVSNPVNGSSEQERGRGPYTV